MLLDGRAQETGIRRRGSDATMLLVHNAHHDLVNFTLPALADGLSWLDLIDTNQPDARMAGGRAGVRLERKPHWPRSISKLEISNEASFADSCRRPVVRGKFWLFDLRGCPGSLLPPGPDLGLSGQLPVRQLRSMHGDRIGHVRFLRHQSSLCLCTPPQGISVISPTFRLKPGPDLSDRTELSGIEIAEPELTAVVFSGGLGLGAYHGGAFEALASVSSRIDWVTGSSAGAITAALIAGSPSADQIRALNSYWRGAGGPAVPPSAGRHLFAWGLSSINTRLLGQAGFFHPRLPLPAPHFGGLYDLGPTRERLRQLIEFDRLNEGHPRITICATDLESGNAVLFEPILESSNPLRLYVMTSSLATVTCPMASKPQPSARAT